MSVLLVMFGAAVGAPSRWALDRFVQSRTTSLFPWGTLLVNVLGCAILGVLVGASAAPDVLLFVGTGFCGGFTTFSTFAYETVVLADEGRGAVARGYVAVSLLAGLGAAWAGWLVGAAVG